MESVDSSETTINTYKTVVHQAKNQVSLNNTLIWNYDFVSKSGTSKAVVIVKVFLFSKKTNVK